MSFADDYDYVQELCAQPGVTDVLINGPNSLWVDQGGGLKKLELPAGILDSQLKVRQFAFQIAIEADERLDEAQPIVDCKLPSGIRFHAIIYPLVQSGAVISLRVPSRVDLNYNQLLETGSIPAHLRDWFPALVQRRSTILITGATGSGKTTFLKALIDLVPANERIICIEEFSEITNLSHPHFVGLSARRKNTEGVGEVTLETLVKASLRMRPDRIVLGECRGREIKELLSAFNTGHSGGFSTLHANDVASVSSRLLALGAQADMTPQAIGAQAFSAIDLVLQMHNVQGRRYLAQVGVPQFSDQQLSIRTIMTHLAGQKIQYTPEMLELLQKI
ncbi:MAG: Flp pilus assembly complex ATPase component TadA [Bifidobacteriaceae bacterium]|jgi:pilus assembly protein CpaF|nr:Flp pilus assembly complex ATPase component TadA [Bifidobacteriaceae bacterium]